MLIADGRPNKPERHLARMDRSTASLGIDGPTTAEWTDLIDALLADWPPDIEGVLKLVVSRGIEGGPPSQSPTAYGTLVAVEETTLRQRRDGIEVISLTLGYPAAIRRESPWLLGGVKYLSYAINMAAKREAASVGADDVIFTSAEGQVLEGPNSTVLWLADGTIYTPPTDTGILRGTTQELLFDTCGELGLKSAEAPTTVAALLETEGVWMCSSTRGVAEVHAIDGTKTTPALITETLQDLVGIPIR